MSDKTAIFMHNFETHRTSACGFIDLLDLNSEPNSFDELFTLIHPNDYIAYLSDQALFLENITKSLTHIIRLKHKSKVVLVKIDYRATFENTIVKSVSIRHTEVLTSEYSMYDI